MKNGLTQFPIISSQIFPRIFLVRVLSGLESLPSPLLSVFSLVSFPLAQLLNCSAGEICKSGERQWKV